MDKRHDDRFKSKNEPGDKESTPVSSTASTADNASVYNKPTVEQATTKGEANKMDENSQEDRKHTP